MMNIGHICIVAKINYNIYKMAMIQKFKMFIENLHTQNVEQISYEEFSEAHGNETDALSDDEINDIYNILKNLKGVVDVVPFELVDNNLYISTDIDDGECDQIEIFIHDYWLYILMSHSGYIDESGDANFEEDCHRIDISDGYGHIYDYVVMLRHKIKKTEH